MSLFSTGGTSKPDFIIVIFLGLSCLLSSILNPLVMIYNYRKKNSIPKILFFILSTCDCMTCLVMPLNSIVRIVKVEPPRCLDTDLGYTCNINLSPTSIERFIGAIILSLSVAPSCFTAVLAITRFITIRFPFRTIKVRYALLFVVLYLCYTLTIHSLVTFDKYAIYKDSANVVTNPYYLNRTITGPPNDIRVLLLCIWPLLLCQVLSIIASGFTVAHLVQKAKGKEDSPSQINSKKVSLKILVTNVSGIILIVLAGIFSWVQIENAKSGLSEKIDEVLEFTLMVTVPIFLSCLNPTIFILFTPNVLKQFSNDNKVYPGSFMPHDTTSYPKSKTKLATTHLRDTYLSPV